MDIQNLWYILDDIQYMDRHSIPEHKHMNQLHRALNKLHLYRKVLGDKRELVHLRLKISNWEWINLLKFRTRVRRFQKDIAKLQKLAAALFGILKSLNKIFATEADKPISKICLL